MMQRSSRTRLALTLPLLALLLGGCASSSPLSKPVPPPPIPPLQAQAKQQDLPTFSLNAQTDIEAWLKSLTDQSSPASPAKPATKP